MVDYHQQIWMLYSLKTALVSHSLEDPIVSRKTLSFSHWIPFHVGIFFFLAFGSALSLAAQEPPVVPAFGASPTHLEWVAPGYQPNVPARIQMALMDDTKPRLNRLTPIQCSDIECEDTSGTDYNTGLQITFHDEPIDSDRNLLPQINKASYDDMAEALSRQLTQPELTTEQRISILQAAFETVAQRTRMDSQLQLEAAQQQHQQQLALLEADRAQVHFQMTSMGNIRQWLQTLYANQSRNAAQIQQMSLDNAALKKSLQTLQQQMDRKTVSQISQPEPMIVMPNASQMLRPQPVMPNETNLDSLSFRDSTSQKQGFSHNGQAVMVWGPVRGYHLKPLETTGTATVSNPKKVIRADYQMQVDREIEGLHQQMEKLTAQIEAFQARRQRMPLTAAPLQPVYSPEQELKPLESHFGNPLPAFQR